MKATASSLALAVAVSVTSAVSSTFGAEPVPAAVPGAAAPKAGAATENGEVAAGDDAQAIPRGARQPAAGDFAMSPEMVRKLSPEQIVSVLREREMRRATFAGRPADIVGGTLFFGALVTMVLLAQIFATRRERLRQETLREMVDKGMEIPPGLIGDRARGSSDLRRGLVLVGAGLGLSLAFALVHLNGQIGSGLWSVGLVPMLIGGGYLVAWRVETRDQSDRP